MDEGVNDEHEHPSSSGVLRYCLYNSSLKVPTASTSSRSVGSLISHAVTATTIVEICKLDSMSSALMLDLAPIHMSPYCEAMSCRLEKFPRCSYDE